MVRDRYRASLNRTLDVASHASKRPELLPRHDAVPVRCSKETCLPRVRAVRKLLVGPVKFVAEANCYRLKGATSSACCSSLRALRLA